MVHVPTESGHWVNEKFAHIAEIINDYDPTMRLAWIPPENRTYFNSPPYAVIHEPDGLASYIVFTIEEDDLDERVLAKIFRGDLKHHNVLESIEALEKANEVMEMKIKMEKAEERQDFIESVVGSHKHSFKHNGVVFPK